VAFGAAPFRDFIHYQLPRLADGRAFDFASEWPELRVPFIADNLSPAAMVEKLGELGVPGMTRKVGLAVLRLYGLALVSFVIVAGRRALRTRRQRAVTWLALLNLAALQSYGAWGDYVTLGSAWMLTLAAASLWPERWPARRPRSGMAWLVAAAWPACFLVPGVQPVVRTIPPPLAMIMTLVVGMTVIGINVRTALAHSGE
jgi:hypothetical protein